LFIDDSNERRVINEDEWNRQQKEDEDPNEEIPHYLKIEKQQPSNWHIVQEVINRQIGNNQLFQRRFYGSLLAVERLALVHKLTGDEVKKLFILHKYTTQKNYGITKFRPKIDEL
jgi:hypothetical protein